LVMMPLVMCATALYALPHFPRYRDYMQYLDLPCCLAFSVRAFMLMLSTVVWMSVLLCAGVLEGHLDPSFMIPYIPVLVAEIMLFLVCIIYDLYRKPVRVEIPTRA
jgi:predicted neutral ceramidase superfamily lipid hydrolase